MRPLFLTLTIPAFTAALAGQSCLNVCVSSHWGEPLVSTQFLPATFAIRVPGLPHSDVICQIEFFCETRSPQPLWMPVWIYDRGPSGAPQSPIASGSMFVDTTPGICTASVQAPMPANADFFIVFDNAIGNLTPPVAGFGSYGSPAQEHWHGGPPSWNGPFATGRYIYRLFCESGSVQGTFTTVGQGCPGTNGVPVIGAVGSAVIGNTVQLTLTQAPAGAPTVVVLSTIPMPINLGSVGAPGCVLEQVPEASFGMVTGATGAAAFPFPIPNNVAFVGLPISAQWAVIEPGANQLGIVFSRGGVLTIGDF
jgi:hypothetical protein